MNDDELKEADREVAAAFVQFRRRLLMAAVFAVAFGLIFAVTTILYAARIEKHARENAKNMNAQRELKQLSRRLVDAGETERRSIARELHDEVGQPLGALLMDVERLKEMSDEEGPFQLKTWKIFRRWRKNASAKCATCPCCCGLRCWMI